MASLLDLLRQVELQLTFQADRTPVRSLAESAAQGVPVELVAQFRLTVELRQQELLVESVSWLETMRHT